ncbi:MAG TPA: hypothetical protein VFO27_15345, partial [Bryobacteraceae bacterium]|nr:hypothetical protein [Bryobacteraceae bacterium]
WVGHFDLTQAMGIPAQFHHSDFLAAIGNVIAAARRHGKVAGINPSVPDQAAEWIAAGFNAISWGNDATIYRTALTAAIQSLRRR